MKIQNSNYTLLLIVLMLAPHLFFAQQYGFVKTETNGYHYQSNIDSYLLPGNEFATLQINKDPKIYWYYNVYDSAGYELSVKVVCYDYYNHNKGVKKMVHDKNGNIYFIGYFANTFGTLQSKGKGDFLLIKWDSNTNFENAIGGCSKNDDGGNDLDLMPDENIITTGFVMDTAIFGQDTLPFHGNADIYVAVYDTTLNLKWAKTIGESGNEIGQCILVNENDTTFYLGGVYDQIITFGTDTLFTKGGLDIFIAKFDKNGKYLFSKSLGGNVNETIYNMEFDSQKNLVVTGSFSNTLYVDTSAFISNGGTDAFVAKMDPLGNVLAVNTLGGPNNDVGKTLSIGRNNNMYWGVDFKDSCVVSNTLVKSASLTSSLILELDSQLHVNWNLLNGHPNLNTGYTTVEKILKDSSDNLIVLGKNNLLNFFGAISLNNNFFERGYVSKIYDQIELFNIPTKICSGDSIDIAFDPKFVPDSNNIFSLWISDSVGSFDNQMLLDTIHGITADTFHVALNNITYSSSRYLFKVTSSSPYKVGISKKAYKIYTGASKILGADSNCVNSSTNLQMENKTELFYQWLLNGVAIPGANNYYYYTQINQFGDFQCVIQNACKYDTSDIHHLSAIPLPNVIFSFGFDTLVRSCTPLNYNLNLNNYANLNGCFFSGPNLINYYLLPIYQIPYNQTYVYDCYKYQSGCYKIVKDSFFLLYDNYIKFANLPTTICQYNAPIPLNTTYPGGTFSSTCANCIQGNTFDPSFGNIATAYDISYSVMGKYNCIETIKESIYISACTGMNDNNAIESITVTNFSNHVNIESKDGFAVYDKWQMIDLTGRIIMENNIQNNSEKFITVDTQKLNNGIYSLIFFGDNTNATFKVHVLK